MKHVCDWRPFDGNQNSFVADGDSITRGVPGMHPWVEFLTPFPSNWLNLNVAVAGATTVDALARAATRVDPEFKPNGKSIVVCWYGTNDSPMLGLTAAQTWANLVSYGDGRRAKGFKTIFVTMLSRTGLDTFKNSLNSLALSDGLNHFDAIVDLTGTTLGADGASADLSLFIDGIHPTTTAAQNVIAPAIQTKINNFL